MAGQSLFAASRIIAKLGESRSLPVGDYDIDFEFYTQAYIYANFAAIAAGTATKCTFGDSDQSKVVIVAGDNITIPSGFNLTPVNPKKSLVICCDKFINNGTISMTAKGPNCLPHDWFILGKDEYDGSDIIIPAYANNRVPAKQGTSLNLRIAPNGNNGTNRNCGSGGLGTKYEYMRIVNCTIGASGSGSAFAGGAGSGGCCLSDRGPDVNTTYPMRGGDGGNGNIDGVRQGGVGNPKGQCKEYAKTTTKVSQNSGVGGRVIIYCVDFENNGNISANGVSSKCVTLSGYAGCYSGGGASGGGCVDIFYTNLIKEGTNTANGGSGYSQKGQDTTGHTGNGGNGCVTLLNWDVQKVILPTVKYMSRANMLYFLQGLVNKRGGN